jgi:hypothetical protein
MTVTVDGYTVINQLPFRRAVDGYTVLLNHPSVVLWMITRSYSITLLSYCG